VTPRRRPRFLPFILTGAVLGFLVGGAIASFGWLEDKNSVLAGNYSPGAEVGYVGLFGAGLFAIAAAVIAVLLDKRADRI
jgi:hypothetical protein